jgi:general secretion pathway protein B
MSSILKALKKLEEEKSARTSDALKIDTEILRGGSPPRFPYRNVTLLALLFFVCGSGLTYLYVKRGAHPAATLPPQAMQQPPAAQEKPRKTLPEEKSIPTTVQVELAPPPQARNAPHAKSLKHNRPTVPAVAGQPKPVVAAQPAAAPAKRIPTLKVDGIAYHFGSTDSLAVVNGNMVYVGAMVEGAKVEDIGKDRIRFNYEGERFEVPLGKSN